MDIDRCYIDRYNARPWLRHVAQASPWSILILLSLACGQPPGLAIAREVLSLSEGQFRLWPAMLYGALEASQRSRLGSKS